MAYQQFPAPLPSPPADGHSLPFLPSKRIELIRRAGAFATPPPRQGSWVFSADSDGDSESSDDSPSARRMSLEERVMSIPTIVLSEFSKARGCQSSLPLCLSSSSIACLSISALRGRHPVVAQRESTSRTPLWFRLATHGTRREDGHDEFRIIVCQQRTRHS